MVRSWSRMQRVQEKQNLKKILLLGLTIVVILAAMVSLGFTALAKMFVVWGDVTSSFRSVEKTDNIPPSPPRLNSDFDATNSATISLAGFAEPGSSVYLQRNQETALQIMVPENGNFLFDEVNLTLGKNRFKAWAVDLSDNKSQDSEELEILFANAPPDLDITSPKEGQIVTGSEAKIEIKGKTDPEAKVTVNERVAIVSMNGTFALKLGLTSGDNTFVVTASDRAGNTIKKELLVVYKP
ncbi:hypothetical protein A2397_00340 [Candidatus Amesbacteria bacterium RIFOXYB1_FULL_44_23]|uniref:Bacterial Ig domain-containing protein n=1 Tax=Candidatus Amesbacteria bacterium RIFOXYB1_FULL_44_23 TaxID=1797263 RepID=A0A1F4ZUD7_9BACT|nr:MAG: hypothetical protein A2397_00340 [Candidatus Amesbacteria bacterium RIFOXYB1_FULL_44_23]